MKPSKSTKYIFFDHGGVIDGDPKGPKVTTNDPNLLIISKNEDITWVFSNGVHFMNMLTELTEKYNYKIVFSSANTVRQQEELLLKWIKAIKKATGLEGPEFDIKDKFTHDMFGTVFPRITNIVAMAADTDPKKEIPFESPQFKIPVVKYSGNARPGKAHMREQLTTYLKIDKEDFGKHYVLDDGPNIIKTAKSEGFNVFEIGISLDTFNAIQEIYTKETQNNETTETTSEFTYIHPEPTSIETKQSKIWNAFKSISPFKAIKDYYTKETQNNETTETTSDFTYIHPEPETNIGTKQSKIWNAFSSINAIKDIYTKETQNKQRTEIETKIGSTTNIQTATQNFKKTLFISLSYLTDPIRNIEDGDIIVKNKCGIKNGVHVLKKLNLLVTNYGYQIAFNSIKSSNFLTEFIQDLKEACTKKGLEFPKITAMLVYDKTKSNMSKPEVISNHSDGILRVVTNDIYADKKTLLDEELSILLKISKSDRNQHTVIDDHEKFLEKAKKDGWNTYSSNLTLKEIIDFIYRQETTKFLSPDPKYIFLDYKGVLDGDIVTGNSVWFKEFAIILNEFNGAKFVFEKGVHFMKILTDLTENYNYKIVFTSEDTTIEEQEELLSMWIRKINEKTKFKKIYPFKQQEQEESKTSSTNSLKCDHPMFGTVFPRISNIAAMTLDIKNMSQPQNLGSSPKFSIPIVHYDSTKGNNKSEMRNQLKKFLNIKEGNYLNNLILDGDDHNVEAATNDGWKAIKIIKMKDTLNAVKSLQFKEHGWVLLLKVNIIMEIENISQFIIEETPVVIDQTKIRSLSTYTDLCNFLIEELFESINQKEFKVHYCQNRTTHLLFEELENQIDWDKFNQFNDVFSIYLYWP